MNNLRITILFSLTFLNILNSKSQTQDSIEIYKEKLDSIFISEVQDVKGKDKVLHAEPLFIDLIRDLGARKGEKEWNVGLGIIDNTDFDRYDALVEYEFAPIDRLGLEVELPFSFYYANLQTGSTPSSRLNSLKLAAQYSFYVSEKKATSLALGYIHEFKTTDFKNTERKSIYYADVFSPFIVVAKRWTNNWHSLIYTGPVITKSHQQKQFHSEIQFNTNIHYMITGTRNFIGIEINKTFQSNQSNVILRPQMRVAIADNFMIGIVSGIPTKKAGERFSNFIRLIYEPGHHSKHKKLI